MTLTPNDDIHIAYHDACGGLPTPTCNFDVIKSTDAGATWTLPVNIATGASMYYLDIATSEDNNLHAMYRDISVLSGWYEDTNVYYRLSSNGGASWSAAQTAWRAVPYTLTTYMASPGVHPYSIDMLWANWPKIGADRTNVPDNGFIANVGVIWPPQERYSIDIVNSLSAEMFSQMIIYNSNLNEVPEFRVEHFLLIVMVVALASLFIHRYRRPKPGRKERGRVFV